jgi:hypothetical protein
MKTYPTFRLVILIVSIIISLSGCSKERFDVIVKDDIVPIAEKETFAPATEQKNTILPLATSKKKINGKDDFPFVTDKGTIINARNYDFSFADGGWVEYPIELEVQELFTPMDMILNKKPTVSNGKILVTAGELNIIASKDGKPLVLNKSSQLSFSFPSNENDFGMKIFYGKEQSNGNVDWELASMQERFIDRRDSLQSAIVFGKNTYSIFPSQIGWINCDRFYDYTGPKTKIRLTSIEPNISTINTFLYLDRIKSVLQIWEGISLDLPVGEHVKLISFAITDQGNIYSFFKDFNIEDGQVVDIKLEKTTKEVFLEYLKNL